MMFGAGWELRHMSISELMHRPERAGRLEVFTGAGRPAQLAGTDPYARWCGRGGLVRGPPIPMDDTSTALRSMSEDNARHVECLTRVGSPRCQARPNARAVRPALIPVRVLFTPCRRGPAAKRSRSARG